MKIAVALVCLAVVVIGENCNHDSDCHWIDCGGGYSRECYQRDPSSRKTCTCVPDIRTYECHKDVDCVDMYGLVCKYGRIDCVGHSHPHCRCHNDD